MYNFAHKKLEGGETQNNFVYGELGRTSLKSRQAVNVIRYWFNTKYVKNIFSLMYRKGDNNQTHMAWASKVNMLLQSIDLYEACMLNQDVGNVNVFINLVNQRVFDVCTELECLYK